MRSASVRRLFRRKRRPNERRKGRPPRRGPRPRGGGGGGESIARWAVAAPNADHARAHCLAERLRQRRRPRRAAEAARRINHNANRKDAPKGVAQTRRASCATSRSSRSAPTLKAANLHRAINLCRAVREDVGKNAQTWRSARRRRRRQTLSRAKGRRPPQRQAAERRPAATRAKPNANTRRHKQTGFHFAANARYCSAARGPIPCTCPICVQRRRAQADNLR